MEISVERSYFITVALGFSSISPFRYFAISSFRHFVISPFRVLNTPICFLHKIIESTNKDDNSDLKHLSLPGTLFI